MNPTYLHPNPLEIAEDLRQRLLDEEWPEDEITTRITSWSDGDCQVLAWHNLERHHTDPPARIEFAYHNGVTKRMRMEMRSSELWEVLGEEVIE